MSESSNNTSHQLLFGFLALQNSFISREQFIAGFTSWVADKSRPIDEILCGSGFLPEDERSIVAELVKKHMAKHGDDTEKSLASIEVTDFATIVPQLRSLGDSDVQATLQPFETEHESARRTRPAARPPSARSATSRFRVVRQHAKGGLGEVFVAIDTELQREVALKKILPFFADDPSSRERFVLEAEITGGLEHPGIVPVYGLGHYPDGRPFYAMRFLRGSSLKQLTDEFFGVNNTGESRFPVARDFAWRQLLGHFISVCKTIDYAHSRGVVHRDIKPSNIMTGRFGEALVVDWGLAKVRGREDSRQEDGETTFLPGSGSGSSATVAGTALGTPAFMSPEQAMGNNNELGPPSDIYSLGSTLYYLLTGRPPYLESNVPATLEKVKQGDFKSPRQLQPKMARAVEAICLKAMALLPPERYENASSLASDLERWLADEPVSAYRGGISERAGRWMRRNRGLVQSAAVGLILITLLSSFAAFAFKVLQKQADLERHNAVVARTEADEERKKAVEFAAKNKELAEQQKILAQSNARLAKKEAEERQRAVKLANRMTVEANKSRRLSDFLIHTFQAADPIGQGAAPGFLPKDKGGELTAREMLDLGAKRVWNDQEFADHPLTRAAIMNAIGDAYRQLGIFDQAEPLLIQALKIRRESLSAKDPDLAVSLHNLAWYYHERGNYPQATPLYAQALEIRSQLPSEEGEILVARTLQNQAWMLANEGWTDEAEAIVRKALTIRMRALGPEHRDTLFSQLALCFVLIEQNKFVLAGIQLGQVYFKRSHLQVDPHVVEAAFEFAWGVINRELVSPTASEKNFAKALKFGIEGFGEDNVYVAVIRCEYGTTLEIQGKVAEALEQYELSVNTGRTKVALEHPRCGILVKRYASLLAELERPTEGKAIWAEFMAAQRRRFDARYGQVLSAACLHGRFLRNIDEYQAAFTVFGDTINTIRSSIAEDSGYRYEPELLGETLNQQALCLLDQHQDLEVAVRLFRESLDAFANADFRTDELQNFIGWPQINLASSLISLGELDAAQAALDVSQGTVDELTGSAHRVLLTYQLEISLKLFVAQKSPAKILATAMELRQLSKRNATDLMRICRNLCSGIATSVATTDTDLRDQLANAAIDTLEMAIAAGYKLEKVSRSKSLKILEDNVRYRAIIKPDASGRTTSDSVKTTQGTEGE